MSTCALGSLSWNVMKEVKTQICRRHAMLGRCAMLGTRQGLTLRINEKTLPGASGMRPVVLCWAGDKFYQQQSQRGGLQWGSLSASEHLQK